MPRVPKKDLSAFHELNEKEKANGKKTPWKVRYELIVQYFPSVVNVEWSRAFKDIELFGRIYKDILRDDRSAETKSGPGPRPALDETKHRGRLTQLLGEDYSYIPFKDAFVGLAGNRSLRHLAAKTGISYVTIHRLLRGERDPDLWMLEQIASAFDKHPSYFIEYRIAYILGALGDQLDKSPETSVDIYKQLTRT